MSSAKLPALPILALTLSLLLSLLGCEQPADPAAVAAASTAKKTAQNQLRQLLQQAESLQLSGERFLKHGDQQHWQALRQAWLDCHISWHQGGFFISQAETPALQFHALSEVIARIHGPVVPGYLDGIEGYPRSGIINDLSLKLDS